jgi:hypothetical protein
MNVRLLQYYCFTLYLDYKFSFANNKYLKNHYQTEYTEFHVENNLTSEFKFYMHIRLFNLVFNNFFWLP